MTPFGCGAETTVKQRAASELAAHNLQILHEEKNMKDTEVKIQPQLFWKMVPALATLPDELKTILAKRYWDSDGYERESRVLLTSEADSDYLEGLRDAEIAGACKLCSLLDDYGSIEIWIE